MRLDKVKGKIFYCEDYLNTDVIAPGRFDPVEGRENLARMCFVDYQPIEPFVNTKTNRSDFVAIVAGRDFGCGSSRETAPLGIAAAGVNVIIAKSFSRIFFRNCINMGGMYPIQLNHDFDVAIHGQLIEIDFTAKRILIQGREFQFPDFGPLEEIIRAGGLGEYTKLKMKQARSL